MRPATTPWLLWRRGYDVHWRALDADEAALMARVRHGASFGAVCEHLIDWVPADAAPLRAAGLLKRWLFDELLQRFEPDSCTSTCCQTQIRNKPRNRSKK